MLTSAAVNAHGPFVVALVGIFGAATVAAEPPPAPALDGGALDATPAATSTRVDGGVAGATPAAPKRPLFVSVSAIPKDAPGATEKHARWWIGVVVAAALGVTFAATITAITLGGGGGDPLFHGNVAPGLERIP